jgi:hypothetical protein
MTGGGQDIEEVVAVLEETHRNLEAIAEEINAEAKFSEEAYRGTEWGELLAFSHGDGSATDDEPTAEDAAELLEQNAANVRVLAEALDVPDVYIEGKTASAGFKDLLGFSDSQAGGE